jgi:hypothetical protein
MLIGYLKILMIVTILLVGPDCSYLVDYWTDLQVDYSCVSPVGELHLPLEIQSITLLFF